MGKELPFERIDEKDFTDMPGTEPLIKFPLNKVGMTNRNHYIKVKDPFTGAAVELFSDVKVFVDLPKNQKGLHMSRIEGELHALKEKDILSIEEYAIALCNAIKKSQAGNKCQIELISNYEKLISKNLLSKRPSHELIQLHIIVESDGETQKITKGITAPFINACPCTQRWGMKDFFYNLKSMGLEEDKIKEIVKSAPLQAHTNKGDATILVESEEIDLPTIYNILEASAPICRELLSGNDENEVVKDAHRRGMFCEDVARELVSNTVKALMNKNESPSTKIRIIVEVDESIHVHNLYAEIEDSLENLNNNLN